jgi:hypothetical protein
MKRDRFDSHCTRRSVFSRITSALLMVTLSACTTYRPISAREYIPISHPSAVYITRPDNTVEVMQLPKLLGDTLVGYVNGDYQELNLSQVKQMNAKVPAGGRTALAVGGGVLAVVAIGALLSGSGSPNLCWDGSLGIFKPCSTAMP